MRSGICAKIADLFSLAAMRLRRRRSRSGGEECQVIHGNMRSAIAVKAPDAMFTGAVFILRDDLLRGPGVSRGELLSQARSAAEGYTAKTLPGRRQPFLSPAALLILGASAAIIALWLCGLI